METSHKSYLKQTVMEHLSTKSGKTLSGPQVTPHSLQFADIAVFELLCRALGQYL